MRDVSSHPGSEDFAQAHGGRFPGRRPVGAARHSRGRRGDVSLRVPRPQRVAARVRTSLRPGTGRCAGVGAPLPATRGPGGGGRAHPRPALPARPLGTGNVSLPGSGAAPAGAGDRRKGGSECVGLSPPSPASSHPHRSLSPPPPPPPPPPTWPPPLRQRREARFQASGSQPARSAELAVCLPSPFPRFARPPRGLTCSFPVTSVGARRWVWPAPRRRGGGASEREGRERVPV